MGRHLYSNQVFRHLTCKLIKLLLCSKQEWGPEAPDLSPACRTTSPQNSGVLLESLSLIPLELTNEETSPDKEGLFQVCSRSILGVSELLGHSLERLIGS